LILNRFPLASVYYRAWIPNHELWMLTQPSSVPRDGVPDADGYAGIEVLDEYAAPRTELRAQHLHELVQFDGVVAMSEFDLIRAARLRHAWRLDGQQMSEVLPYRDKMLMKTVLRRAGVSVAEHAALDGVADLLAFIEQVGFPVVVKPRRGASSIGVRVLEAPDDVTDLLGPGSPLAGDAPPDMLVEQFVPNEMYNVDGIVVDAKERVCWPSATTSCLGFTERDHLLAATLDPGDPVRVPLQDLVRAALVALPTRPTSIFHAEVFRSTDGRLILNEIGCRIGGAKVRDVVQLGFGVDLVEWYVREEYGGGASFRPPVVPRIQSGYGLLPPREGTVTRVPDACALPGVAVYEPRARVGDTLAGPSSSIDAMAAVAVVGASREMVTSRLRVAASWLESEIEVVAP